MKDVKVFWIRFQLDDGYVYPAGTRMGCGVTAYSEFEAMRPIKNVVFGDQDLPLVAEIIEIEDVSQLDSNHVIPNMGNFLKPGVWFPMGYTENK